MPKKPTNIQEYQILTNNDEVCVPSLSSILLAVYEMPEVLADEVFCNVFFFSFLKPLDD